MNGRICQARIGKAAAQREIFTYVMRARKAAVRQKNGSKKSNRFDSLGWILVFADLFNALKRPPNGERIH